MSRFQMSSPELAVVTVQRLEAEGFEAGIDVVADGETHSFVSAWVTPASPDEDALPALVRDLDPDAIHTGDEANSGSHPDPSPQ
jgi:hypothetical protein